MKKKSWLVILLLFAGLLFVTNPDQEKLYRKALQDELGVGDLLFSEAKYALVEVKYDYKNYYLIGVLKTEKNEDVEYIGFLNQVIRL